MNYSDHDNPPSDENFPEGVQAGEGQSSEGFTESRVDLLPPLQILNQLQKGDSLEKNETALSSEFQAESQPEELLPVGPLEAGEKTSETPESLIPLKRRKIKKEKAQLKNKLDLERARNRQMSYLQKRRERKRLRVLFNRVHSILRFAAGIFLLVTLVYILNTSFWRVPAASAMTIDTFRYYQPGSHHLIKPTDITPILKTYQSQFIFFINPIAIEQKIQTQFPVIEKAYVRRYLFPARFEITLIEKKPWAAIYTDAGSTVPYALIDSHYGIFPLNSYPHANLPDYMTHQPVPMQKLIIPPGTQWPIAYLQRIHQLIYTLQSIPGFQLQSMDLTHPDAILAHFQDMDVLIGKLNRSTEARISRLFVLAPKLAQLKGWVDQVDIHWENQTTLHRSPTWTKAATSGQGVPTVPELFFRISDESAATKKIHSTKTSATHH